MDTKTRTGGPSQLEICSTLFFLRNTGTSIFSYHVITTQATLRMYPLFIRTYYFCKRRDFENELIKKLNAKRFLKHRHAKRARVTFL